MGVSRATAQTCQQAYLSTRLLHSIIPNIAADRGIERSAHSRRFGRDRARMGAVALIIQQLGRPATVDESYIQRRPTRSEKRAVMDSRVCWREAAADGGGGDEGDVEARAARWFEKVATCTARKQSSASSRPVPRGAQRGCDGIVVAGLESVAGGIVQWAAYLCLMMLLAKMRITTA
jgi:hypothetical protein